MKQLLALLMIMICSQLQAQWHPFPISNTRPLSDVAFISENTAYAGGGDGIYKSTDGGTTWHLLPYFQSPSTSADSSFFTSMNEHHFFFLSEEIGFSAGWSSLGGMESIIKTKDGGSTWTINHFENNLNPNNVESALRDIHFVSPTIGFAVGFYGRILKTTDAGVNWTATAIGKTNNLYAVQFLDALNGYIVGDKVFLSTQDGGQNWTVSTSPYHFTDFHFFNIDKGIAITADGMILHTEDRGKTWAPHHMKLASVLQKIAFTDELNGFITGGTIEGLILKTEDGGTTWYHNFQLASEGILSVSMLNSFNGLASTSKGTLLLTTTGGGTSGPVPVPALTSFSPEGGVTNTEVTIKGEHLNQVHAVLFSDNKPVPFYIKSSTEIIAKVPTGAETGVLTLRYKDGSVLSTTDFEIYNSPVFYPLPNYHIAGHSLYIKGENLENISQVKHGLQSFPFEVIDNDSLKVDIPVDYCCTGMENLRWTITDPSYGSYTLEPTIFIGRPVFYSISKNDYYNSYGYRYAPVAAGSDSYIHGYDLIFVEKVTIGGIPIPFTIINNKTLKINVPANAKTGYLEMTGRSGTVQSSRPVIVMQDPELLQVEPNTAKSGESVFLKVKNVLPPTYSGAVMTVGDKGSEYKLINDSTVSLVMPLMSGNQEIRYRWLDYQKVSNALAITLLEPALPKIDKILPGTGVSIGDKVQIQGTFHAYEIDSIKIGNARILANGITVPGGSIFPSTIEFTLPSSATSSKVKLYTKQGIAVSDQVLPVNATPPPFPATITPTIANTGSKVILKGQYLYEIYKISLNGISIPFNVQSASELSLLLPQGVNTGPLELHGKYGSTKSDFELTILEDEIAGPVIIKIQDEKVVNGVLLSNTSESTSPSHSSEKLLVIGNNMAKVTSVWLDDVPVENYTILNNDTLVFRMPVLTRSKGADTRLELTLKSPHGQASGRVDYGFKRTRKIISVSSLNAARSAILEIKLEPDRPDIEFFQAQSFFFNGVRANWVKKERDDLFLVSVPEKGDVEGKIGVGFQVTSAIEWTKEEFSIENDYCAATGMPPHNLSKPPRSFTQFRFADFKQNSLGDCSFYSSFLDSSIELMPGQMYPLSFRISDCSDLKADVNLANYHFKIYIDFNADGDFYDDGEEVISFASPRLREATTFKFWIKIPTHVPIGKQARLRLRVIDKSIENDLEPCGVKGSSEVEDYLVKFAAASSTFEITNFYPKEANIGSKIMLNGAGFEDLENVLVGGAQATFTYLNANTLLVTVPEDAKTGKLAVVAGGANVESLQEFTLNTAYQPSLLEGYSQFGNNNPADTLSFAFMGNNSLPVYVWGETSDFANITALFPQTLVNDSICIYNKGGGICTKIANALTPEITSLNPFSTAKVGQMVSIYGNNFHQISSITFNGVAASVFEVVDVNKIIVKVPMGASTGRVAVSGINGTHERFTDYTILSEYCVDTNNASTLDYIESISIGNKLFRQTTPPPKRHTVHAEEIPVLAGMTYTFQIKTRNKLFDYHTIYIDKNNDFVFSDPIYDAGHTKAGGIGSTTISDYLSLGARIPIRLIVHQGRRTEEWDPCIIRDNEEVHDFTLVVTKPERMASRFIPVIQASQEEACTGETFNFQVINADKSSVSTYHWNFGDGATSSQENPVHQYAKPGTYQVSVSLIQGEQLSYESVISLKVTGPPAVTISSSSFVACEGEFVTLFTSSTYAAYKWSNGASTPQLQVSESGAYTIRVMNAQGCWSEPSPAVNVEISSLAVPTIHLLDEILYSSEAVRYVWFKDGVKLSDQGAAIPYTGPGSYQVEVFDDLDCSKISESYYFDFVLGIEAEPVDDGIAVYPNPASGTVWVEVKESLKIRQVTLNSIQMQNIVTMESNEDKLYLDIRSIKPGVYILSIALNNNTVVMRKMIIK